MSQITFPVERIGPIANYMQWGIPQMEVTLNVSQTHMRTLLNEIAKSVPDETLAEWLLEDLDWQVTDAEVTQ